MTEDMEDKIVAVNYYRYDPITDEQIPVYIKVYFQRTDGSRICWTDRGFSNIEAAKDHVLKFLQDYPELDKIFVEIYKYEGGTNYTSVWYKRGIDKKWHCYRVKGDRTQNI